MSERPGIHDELQELEDGLLGLRGQLEGLSAAIWHAIDHEDPAALEAGVRFKQEYNERRGALEGAMDLMLALLRHYPRPGPDTGLGTEPAEPQVAPEGPVRTPNAAPPPSGGEAVPLARGLDQRVPFGFVLGGQTFSSASAWPLFYEALLQEFYSRDAAKLSRLVESPAFQREGKPLFARVPDLLEDPLPIADSLFAEADMAPETLLLVVKRLIAYLGYPLESFKVLLKEKNRGTVETLSLAA